MEFEEALAGLGFALADRRASKGLRTYVAEPNRFMTYTVQAYEDGTALFSWEFAIADFLETRGIQVGSNESLNLFMYPRSDERGPQDAAWLASTIERAEGRLRALRFDAPED